MQSLLKIFKNQNPFFLAEAVDYIEANGFYHSEKIIGATMYRKDDKAIVIAGDKVSFRFLDLGEDEADDVRFIEQSSFEGISILTITDWMYLLHIAKMITLKSLIQNVRKANEQPLNMVQIAESFFENVKTVCVVLLIACSILFCSCSTQQHVTAHLYQRKGIMMQTAKGYQFKPLTAWEDYKPQHVTGDTIYQFADRLPRIIK